MDLFFRTIKKPSFIIFSTILFCCACNNNVTTDALLQQPPYRQLSDSIKSDPQNAGLYYRRGNLLFDNKQWAYAEKDIRNAWSINPKEEYALGLADVLSKKNTDSVIIFLQAAIQKLPQSVALQISLAKNLHQKKDNEKALAICNEITVQYPNQIDALLLQSEILKEENKADMALAALEKAYSYSPSDVELAYSLAFEYAQNKNPKALILTDSLIKMDSLKTHGEPFYFKGIYYENAGDNNRALRYLNEAIQHDYYLLDAYMEKGQILFNQKKYNDALKTFQLAATITPTFADAYYWMGKCQEIMNNKAEAKLNYQRAYGLDKSLTDAKQAADKL